MIGTKSELLFALLVCVSAPFLMGILVGYMLFS
ncbi:hypothetical protein LD11_gp089 [Bacillus phage Riley]|uniref:Uncharacterized protein n=2 Tax=Bequatrovirus riley TaxID=1918007 RepID=A0A075M0B1_9CAUD|nr:hypothetical protein LD11_gp089 [Bacillus phage Riley]AIF71965.1 hypothetical protein [Bacillus phage Riley]ASZ75823.1 hypothetical protein TAFFO16_90 [Bacillus phage Taffo16]ULF48711.1 membrane protein [Bacillus phage BillyBob]